MPKVFVRIPSLHLSFENYPRTSPPFSSLRLKRYYYPYPQGALPKPPAHLANTLRPTDTLRPTNKQRHRLRPRRPWTKQVPPRPPWPSLAMTPWTALTRAETRQHRDRRRLLDLKPRVSVALDVIVR